MDWNIGTEVATLIQHLGITAKTLAIILAVISVWEIIWKGFGLWAAGRNRQPWWFVAMLVLNSIGIIPIIYLFFFQPEEAEAQDLENN